jgi:glutamyl-tRNA reductase
MSEKSTQLPIAVCGCDFRRASSRWRSRLVLDDEEREGLVRELARSGSVDGFLDLTTCNRTEWIVSAAEPSWAGELLRAQMLERLAGSEERIEPYVYCGEEAARHVFSVSIGQESFVVGERQIATQLFSALEGARSRGTSSRLLNGLGSVTGRLVRDAVREGCIGGPAAGVHSLAAHFVLEWLRARTDGRTVCVVGLGAIGRLVRGLFEQSGEARLIPVNRSVPAGEEGRVRPIRELSVAIAGADAVVVCTSAPHHVVKTSTLEGRDPERPLLVLDLGIPEQVDALDPRTGATRAGLDDLTADPVGSPGAEEQLRHVQAAERLVSRALEDLRIFARERSVVEIFDEVRRRHERFVDEEIPALVGEMAGDLDASRKAHLVFGLKGRVLAYTNDVFRAIKRSLEDVEEDDWSDVS